MTPLLYSPRRPPRHAPCTWRWLLVQITIICRHTRSVEAYKFMAAATHQRVVMDMIKDLPPGMRLRLFDKGFTLMNESETDDQ